MENVVLVETLKHLQNSTRPIPEDRGHKIYIKINKPFKKPLRQHWTIVLSLKLYEVMEYPGRLFGSENLCHEEGKVIEIEAKCNKFVNSLK
jgi:hypothetical protein